MNRTPQIFVLGIAALLGLTLAAWLWQRADQMPRAGSVVSEGVAEIGGPFTLTDHTGAKRSDADFRGRLMLIYFGYSNCPDVCPTTLAVMAEALEKLGPKASAVAPIFISTDPEHDSPAILAIYMKAFGPSFIGLTGDGKSIDAAMKAYRVYSKKRELPGGGYAVDHTSVIYLMDAQGKFIRHFDESVSPDELAKELEKSL